MTPRQIGIYRLDDLLGSGGMGDVYKAYDTHRERYVALKLLPAAFSGDEAYLKRFRRESNVVARLREPHLIPIHDFGEVNGQLFIDMRLVDGADIGALLDANGRIAPQRAVHLIGQVAQALDAAHADQLVHRDIKPSNILVTSSDFVYVVDFGVARPLGAGQASLTTAEATIGTLHYMAPERFAGQEVDGRADVYSLACVLHECLTGVPPFSGKDDLPSLMYAHLHSVPPQASTLAEGVPPALDAVIARGMAKDPGDRFPTAGALAAAAREALLAEASTSAMTEPPVQMTEPPVQALTEIPDPTWQAAGAAVAMQSLAAPLGSEAEPAGDRFAHGVAGSQTQTIDWGGAPPPQDMPRGAGPDLDGSRPPARGPAWRRLSVLILVLVAVLAVPIALILVANARSHKDGAAAAPNTGGATGKIGRASCRERVSLHV
jgi:serine/threonine protein kinase